MTLVRSTFRTWLILAIMTPILGACRGASPTTGTPLHRGRITTTSLPTTASSFTSTAADLGSIQATINSSLRIGGSDVLNPSASTAGLTWNFEGTDEEVPLAGPFVGTHITRIESTTLVPSGVSIGSIPALIGSCTPVATPPASCAALAGTPLAACPPCGTCVGELATLACDPILNPILSASGLTGLSLPAIPPPFDTIVTSIDLSMGLDSTTLSWLAAPPTGTAPATLRAAIPIGVRPRIVSSLAGFFRIATYTTGMNVDMPVVACGTCNGIACADGPGPVPGLSAPAPGVLAGAVARGYRTQIAPVNQRA